MTIEERIESLQRKIGKLSMQLATETDPEKVSCIEDRICDCYENISDYEGRLVAAESDRRKGEEL